MGKRRKAASDEELEREIKNLERAIGIMQSMGLKAVKHNGQPVPGLSVEDWQARLYFLKDARATNRVVDLHRLDEDFFTMVQPKPDTADPEDFG